MRPFRSHSKTDDTDDDGRGGVDELKGLELRRKVAGILRWRVMPCTRIMAGREDEGFELIMPDNRSWGPWRPTDADVWKCDCPRFESDAATLPEMWQWLRSQEVAVDMTVYPSGCGTAQYREVDVNNAVGGVEQVFSDPSNPVTAVARLVVAVAEARKGEG